MNKSTKNLFLAAAVAGVVSAGAIMTSTVALAKDEVKGSCAQNNACEGKGGCKGMAAGAKHECKGHNGCKNNVIENTTEAKCKKMKGTFTPNA